MGTLGGLSAAEARIAELETELAAAETQIADLQADNAGLSAARWQVQRANAELRACATSLAALEAAARALVAGCPVGDPLPLNVSPLVYALHQAVGALDTNEPVGP